MPITTYVAGETLTAASLNNNFAVASKIVQIVTGSTSTQVSSSTTTFVDTLLTATITPTSASNLILIVASQQGCEKDNQNSNNGLAMRLMRGATSIQVFAEALLVTSTTLLMRGSVTTQFLDNPATTSATTYKTQFANRVNAAQVSVQVTSNVQSFITLYEVTP